jgi:cobalt-zinc-cadmium efflux system membrane fusion protein
VGELTRSAKARVVLDNPGEAWRPGLFVTAEVEVDEVKAPVVVVEEAVQTLDGKEVVFVREGSASGGWRFEARRVKLGPHGHRDDNRRVYAVHSGVKAGESYVGKQSFLLKAELGKGAAGHEH